VILVILLSTLLLLVVVVADLLPQLVEVEVVVVLVV
jgi:hypothetical protein